MAKQIKSIRFDEYLVEVFEDYSSLLAELFGNKLSFASFVNEATAAFLVQSLKHWTSAMETNSVVDRQANGKLKRYEFTEEQISKMKDLLNEAYSVYAEYLV